MAAFCAILRLNADDDMEPRYHTIEAEIRSHSEGVIWSETPSVLMFESHHTTKTLGDFIYYGSRLDETKDMFVLINLSIKSHYVVGEFKFPNTLGSVMASR
jgi:hypothetical protein